MSYLWHDDADVVDALDHRLAAAGDCDRPLGGVGQHLTRHLHRGSGHLPDLLDLAATLPDEGAALAGGHHQAEGDGGPGHCARGYEVVEILNKSYSSTVHMLLRT